MISLLDVQKARSGLPTANSMAMLWGCRSSKPAQGCKGILPMKLPTSGESLKAYKIYGSTKSIYQNYVNMNSMTLNFSVSAQLELDSEGCITLRSENDTRSYAYKNANIKNIPLPAGTYTVAAMFDVQSGSLECGMGMGISGGSELFRTAAGELTGVSKVHRTFTLAENSNVWLLVKPFDGHIKIMLTKTGFPVNYYVPYGTPSTDRTGTATVSGEPSGYKVEIKSAKLAKDLLPAENKWSAGYMHGGEGLPPDTACREIYSAKPARVRAWHDYRVKCSEAHGGDLGYWVSMSWHDSSGSWISDSVYTNKAEFTATSPTNAAFVTISIRSYGSADACAQIYDAADMISTLTNIYIGTSKLAAGDYIDSKTGYIYRDIGMGHIPSQPPVPLPEIPTYPEATEFSCKCVIQPEEAVLIP